MRCFRVAVSPLSICILPVYKSMGIREVVCLECTTDPGSFSICYWDHKCSRVGALGVEIDRCMLLGCIRDGAYDNYCRQYTLAVLLTIEHLCTYWMSYNLVQQFGSLNCTKRPYTLQLRSYTVAPKPAFVYSCGGTRALFGGHKPPTTLSSPSITKNGHISYKCAHIALRINRSTTCKHLTNECPTLSHSYNITQNLFQIYLLLSNTTDN